MREGGGEGQEVGWGGGLSDQFCVWHVPLERAGRMGGEVWVVIRWSVRPRGRVNSCRLNH